MTGAERTRGSRSRPLPARPAARIAFAGLVGGARRSLSARAGTSPGWYEWVLRRPRLVPEQYERGIEARRAMTDPARWATVEELDRAGLDTPGRSRRPLAASIKAALVAVPVPAADLGVQRLPRRRRDRHLHARARRPRGGPTPFVLPWPVVALGFFLVETKVVEVNFRRETHSLSLSEFPAVVGFFFLNPADYLGALLIGTIAALVFVSRQSPLQGPVQRQQLRGDRGRVAGDLRPAGRSSEGTPTPVDWVAAFAATIVASVLAALDIATVITLSGGAPQFKKLPEMLKFGILVAIANTSLALLAVSIMFVEPDLLWLLAVPIVIVFLAYRSWISEREKHERLELLYQSSRILQDSPELDSALVALLDHAREMFRAERAEVILYPPSRDVEALRTASLNDGEPVIMVPLHDVRSDPRPAARRPRAATLPVLARPRRSRARTPRCARRWSARCAASRASSAAWSSSTA